MCTQHKRATWMCLISPAVRSPRHIHSLVFGLFESSASLFPSFLASLALIYGTRTPLPPFVYSSTCLSIRLSAGLFSVSFLSICLHLHCVSFLPGTRFNFLPTLLFHFFLFLTVFPLFNLSLSRLTTRFLLEDTNASLSRPADVRSAEARCPRRRLSALLSSFPFLLFSLCRH